MSMAMLMEGIKLLQRFAGREQIKIIQHGVSLSLSISLEELKISWAPAANTDSINANSQQRLVWISSWIWI